VKIFLSYASWKTIATGRLYALLFVGSLFAATPASAALPGAIETNTLLWLAGTPNLGAEVSLSKHLSLAASGAVADWHIKSRYSLQAAKGGLDLKYWFNDNCCGSFTGWHCGVWGVLGGRFDVQWGSGWQGDRFYSTGIVGGYSLAIGRALNLELSASPGWFFTPEMRHYHAADNLLVWQQTRYNAGRFMFKCAVNLVWLPGKNKR
jgi:hypothetical protein